MKTIPLTQGFFAQVDDEDYDQLMQYKWYAVTVKNSNTVYAQRDEYVDGIRKCIKMHRFILGVVYSKDLVDHVDRNGLNNQRINLRKVNSAQNNQNRGRNLLVNKNYSSVYKRVCWDKSKNKWLASIKHNGKQKHLGRFDSEIDAAKAYNKAAIELFGEFANLNVV